MLIFKNLLFFSFAVLSCLSIKASESAKTIPIVTPEQKAAIAQAAIEHTKTVQHNIDRGSIPSMALSTQSSPLDCAPSGIYSLADYVTKYVPRYADWFP